jgi:hypothetical protein
MMAVVDLVGVKGFTFELTGQHRRYFAPRVLTSRNPRGAKGGERSAGGHRSSILNGPSPPTASKVVCRSLWPIGCRRLDQDHMDSRVPDSARVDLECRPPGHSTAFRQKRPKFGSAGRCGRLISAGNCASDITTILPGHCRANLP